jgi:hypothetical protein
MMSVAACVVALAVPPIAANAASKPKLYMTTPAVGVLAAGTPLLLQIGVVAPSPSGAEGQACIHQTSWPLLENAASNDRIAGSTEDFACAPERNQPIAITLSTRGKVSVRSTNAGTALILTDPPCEWEATAMTGKVALPAPAEGIPLSGKAHKGEHAATGCPAHAHVRGTLSLLTAAADETVQLETR